MQPTTIDVLLFTLKYLSSKEALRISTVCKDIHVVVIHMVLSRGIRLGYPQQLFRFPYFITADSSTRIPFLRGLYMHSRAIPHWSQLLMTTTDQSALAPPNNFAFFLTQILIRSTCLRSLSLNASEFLLMRHPSLREALIQYRGLVELSLTDVTEDVLRVVRAMRSNIRVLSLSHPISRGIRLPGTLQYIATHAHLEKLRFTATSGDRSVWNFSTTIQWPAVRELRVYGIVSLDLLVAAFPNVRSLHVDEIGIDHPVPSAQWSNLDFLHGQLLLLQSWQIQCPVRRLDLCLDEWVFDCFTPINYTDTAAQLVSLMERTTPMILSFDVGYNAPLEFWETVAPAMHSVKLLELSVWFDVFDREKWENDERAKSERNEMSEDEEDEGAMDVDEEDDDSAMDDDDDDGSGDDGNGDDGHGDYDKEGLKVEFKEFLLARAAEWIVSAFLMETYKITAEHVVPSGDGAAVYRQASCSLPVDLICPTVGLSITLEEGVKRSIN